MAAGCSHPFLHLVPGLVCPQDTGVMGERYLRPRETSVGTEEAAQKSSQCHACYFLVPAFPSSKRFGVSLLSPSHARQGCSKNQNKHQRAEGVETLEHSISNNWSKNSHFLHEGRKEENGASVSAEVYLLNSCLFSMWDNTAIQSLFLTSQSGYQARTPQGKVLSPPQSHSHWLRLLIPLASVHTYTQSGRHHDGGTDGLTRCNTMGLMDVKCEQRMTPSSIGASERAT